VGVAQNGAMDVDLSCLNPTPGTPLLPLASVLRDPSPSILRSDTVACQSESPTVFLCALILKCRGRVSERRIPSAIEAMAGRHMSCTYMWDNVQTES
jgi:hypothetical protein